MEVSGRVIEGSRREATRNGLCSRATTDTGEAERRKMSGVILGTFTGVS